LTDDETGNWNERSAELLDQFIGEMDAAQKDRVLAARRKKRKPAPRRKQDRPRDLRPEHWSRIEWDRAERIRGRAGRIRSGLVPTWHEVLLSRMEYGIWYEEEALAKNLSGRPGAVGVLVRKGWAERRIKAGYDPDLGRVPSDVIEYRDGRPTVMVSKKQIQRGKHQVRITISGVAHQRFLEMLYG
jgi:hypothetical protein